MVMGASEGKPAAVFLTAPWLAKRAARRVPDARVMTATTDEDSRWRPLSPGQKCSSGNDFPACFAVPSQIQTRVCKILELSVGWNYA